jgi:hypothetical protein
MPTPKQQRRRALELLEGIHRRLHRGDHAGLRVQDRAAGRAGQRWARDGEHRGHGRRHTPDRSHPYAHYRGWPAGAHEASMALILKRASVGRVSCSASVSRAASVKSVPLARTPSRSRSSLHYQTVRPHEAAEQCPHGALRPQLETDKASVETLQNEVSKWTQRYERFQ